MIESLAQHGVCAADLVPALQTTHTVRNPEYDPAEAAEKELRDRETAIEKEKERLAEDPDEEEDDITVIGEAPEGKTEPALDDPPTPSTPALPPETPTQTTANVLQPTAPVSMPGVSTSLSSTDENVTLDIRWTVLCDLFLLLIADSVYDARSRVLLENIAAKMGLGWLDVVKFEKRVTDALEIQEGIEKLEQKEVIEGREAAAKKKRYLMVGLATIGEQASDQDLESGRFTLLFSRWRPRHRIISWSPCSRHRRRSRRSVWHSRHFWHDRIPDQHGWRGHNYHWRYPYWFQYRRERNGEADSASQDV